MRTIKMVIIKNSVLVLCFTISFISCASESSGKLSQKTATIDKHMEKEINDGLKVSCDLVRHILEHGTQEAKDGLTKFMHELSYTHTRMKKWSALVETTLARGDKTEIQKLIDTTYDKSGRRAARKAARRKKRESTKSSLRSVNAFYVCESEWREQERVRILNERLSRLNIGDAQKTAAADTKENRRS